MKPAEIIDAILKIENDEHPSCDIEPILTAHRCFYLLSKVQTDSQNTRAKAERMMNVLSTKERLLACRALFSQDTIPYAVIKGAVLSQSAYGDPFFRSSGDIDVLIDRDDSDKLKGLLGQSGFIQGRIQNDEIVPFTKEERLFHSLLTHQQAPFVKKTSNRFCPFVNVDVNQSIYWEPHPHVVVTKDVLQYTEDVELLGVRFKKLSKEMEFVSLCLHHFKDMNSPFLLMHGKLLFSHFCDIYHFLKQSKPDAKRLIDLCNRTFSGKYLYTCLYYTYEIYKNEIVQTYLHELEIFKDPALIDTYGLEEDNKKKWDIDLFDRIFGNDTASYVRARLTDEEYEKIKLNEKYM